VQGVAEPEITVTGVRKGESIRLSVVDNGPGVAPDIAELLFSPFTTGKQGGLGLGLAIARDIAREFGGDISHAQGRNGGAAFHLTLRAC